MSLEWNNHLRVGFGTEGTRLKERLSVPDTSLVNIQSGFDIIYGVDYKVQTFPEAIIEDVFSV